MMELKNRKKAKTVSILVVVGILGGLQFFPVERMNPPVEKDVNAPPGVRAILRRACYDCHSHETVRPWYSRVAPISLLMAHDVEEGREELNFSRWRFDDPVTESQARRRVWQVVEEGEMPLWFYVPLHPDAQLTDADKALLKAWALRSAAPAVPPIAEAL